MDGILNALNNDQAFYSRLFTHKKIRNYIIVCQTHVWHFLSEEECDCVMVDGECFRFGKECLGKYFCYNCLSDRLELNHHYMKNFVWGEEKVLWADCWTTWVGTKPWYSSSQ